MVKYSNPTSRITVKIIDSDNDNELFEIKGRNWTNVGELFPSGTLTTLIQTEYNNKTISYIPKNIMVIAVAEYNLN
jgi:hypothetical protein